MKYTNADIHNGFRFTVAESYYSVEDVNQKRGMCTLISSTDSYQNYGINTIVQQLNAKNWFAITQKELDYEIY